MQAHRLPRNAVHAASLVLLLALIAGVALPGAAAQGRDTTGAPAPASVTAAGAAAGPAAPHTVVSAATDSARRAYRAWRRRLKVRALADSVAHADSLARADSVARATAVPPPSDYVAEVRANFSSENRAYATTRAALGFIEPLWTILIGLFLLFSGLSAALRDAARRASSRPYAQALVYVLLFLAADFILSLPLAFYQGYALEHRYGLSTESFGAWFLDQWKGLLVALVFLGVIPLVRLAYVPVRRFPRHWWLVLGLSTLPVFLAGTLLQPLVVDPLFNRFTPLKDQRLEARILEVARQVGVPARHVFQVDRSRQTRKLGAYVSGFGPSQRIVLWDTTLRTMKPDEILFVVGHEAAHYRLHHMWWGILAAWLLSFAVFGLSAIFMRGAVARWGGRWGLRELHDIASLPLFVVALTLFTFLAQPGTSAFSRGMERDADTYGLEVTHLNDAAARAFMKLGAQNRSDPDPPAFVRLIQYDHPPLLERVRFALEYRPWEQGRPDRLYRPRPRR